MGKLDGKIAVITGGASGIGEGTVRLFVAEGARVVVADILDDKGECLARDLGENACYLHTDVSREPDVKAAIDHAVTRFGRLDCLFNNAGFGTDLRSNADISVEDYESHMGVLLRGVFLDMKHAAPVMKRQGSGSIINNASVAGIQTLFGNHLYTAAKAAVIHLTRSVAVELGESGIRVNSICPGAIATPIFGKAFGFSLEAADQTLETVKAVLAPTVPLQRAGVPDDIARAALWLASDEASFVTGHALVVDGGLTAGHGVLWSQFLQMWDQGRAAIGEGVAAGQ